MTSEIRLFVVLAAGEGTRMLSSVPKAMHLLAGEPMLGHVLRSVAGMGEVAVVVAPGMEEVARYAADHAAGAKGFVQAERLGTAHAALAARDALAVHEGPIFVLYGDTPLVRRETVERLAAALAGGADLAVLGFHAADPDGYGRLIVDAGRLVAIREERDASEPERALTLCNSGVMAFRRGLLPGLLDEIGNDNAKREYYLTDAVELANARGLRVVVVEAGEEEVLGVNGRAQLARAEAVLQKRLRTAAMEAGATLVAPETVFLCQDTTFGRDVVVEPNVVFGPGVTVGEGATIRAFCHIEGARIAPGATVGPFARLRPGTELGAGVRIGNFVEVKAAVLDAGVKANHLAYIGDAHVGEATNVGAGTIFCNYDGSAKHHSEVGAGVFIGSNSALVAPVTLGDGCYIGTGSVITKNVPEGALAIARGRQVEKPGWVAAFATRQRSQQPKPGLKKSEE